MYDRRARTSANRHGVQITDAERNTPLVEVPKEAVIITNLPQILQALKEHDAPQEISKTLEQDAGLGLLACRIVERFEDNGLVRIELPAVSGDSEILVDQTSLARRV